MTSSSAPRASRWVRAPAARRDQDEGARHQRGAPGVEQPPEREHEEVEAEVAPEERIGLAEGGAVEVLDHGRPGAGGAGPREDRDHPDDRQEEAAHQRLEDGAPGQPELILQLPQHVGRRGPGRHREIDEEEDEDRGPQPEEEPAADRQPRSEDGGEADLLEPQPVRVERDRLAHHGEDDQAHEDPETGPRAPQGYDSTAGRHLRQALRPYVRRVSPATARERSVTSWSVMGPGRGPRDAGFGGGRRQTPASSRRSLTRFVRSHVNSGSLRPKCP